jgi:hypothetical protein
MNKRPEGVIFTDISSEKYSLPEMKIILLPYVPCFVEIKVGL